MIPAGVLIGAQMLGAGASAYAQYKGVQRQNETQRELARDQMEFQERMSNTAWQRSVADMRMAGINPMLAFMKGGASSPSGSMANVRDAIGPAVNSAMSALRLEKEMRLLDTQRAKLLADIGNVHAQTYKTTQEGGLLTFGESGKPSYARLQQRYRAELLQLQKMLMSAGYDAAKVKGSRIGGILQLLFGGMSSMPFNYTVSERR